MVVFDGMIIIQKHTSLDKKKNARLAFYWTKQAYLK